MKASLKLAVLAVLSLFAVNNVAMAQETMEKDLVQIAADEGNFTVWARALEQAGLTTTFQGAGPYTVFAPTDEAFAKIPQAELDSLMADPQAVRELVLNHVMEGDVMATDVSAMTSATTMGGSSVAITKEGETVRINGSTVTRSDLQARNGRIHVIDTVILPPTRQ